MDSIDLTQLSPSLFAIAVVFFLGAGSLFSLGFLRCFQQRIQQGVVYFSSSVVCFVAFIFILLKWYI